MKRGFRVPERAHGAVLRGISGGFATFAYWSGVPLRARLSSPNPEPSLQHGQAFILAQIFPYLHTSNATARYFLTIYPIFLCTAAGNLGMMRLSQRRRLSKRVSLASPERIQGPALN